MTTLKAGTPTGFQDCICTVIKVGDRIKHGDGTILVIDKYGRAVSKYGIATTLDKLCPVDRGIDLRGQHYARLRDYMITNEPAPAKPEGETVKPGSDSDNMAPDRVRDPRNESLKKENWHKTKAAEEKAVQEGCTLSEARRILTLQDFTVEELCAELRDRGYFGQVTKRITIEK